MVHCGVEAVTSRCFNPVKDEPFQLCTYDVRRSRCSGRRHDQRRLYEGFIAASPYTDAVAGVKKLASLLLNPACAEERPCTRANDRLYRR